MSLCVSICVSTSPLVFFLNLDTYNVLILVGARPICNIATQPFKGCFEMIANRDIEVAEQVM